MFTILELIDTEASSRHYNRILNTAVFQIYLKMRLFSILTHTPSREKHTRFAFNIYEPYLSIRRRRKNLSQLLLRSLAVQSHDVQYMLRKWILTVNKGFLLTNLCSSVELWPCRFLYLLWMLLLFFFIRELSLKRNCAHVSWDATTWVRLTMVSKQW